MAFNAKICEKSSGGYSSSTLLPDPDSSLNKIVPSSAIAKANKIVAPILPSAANHGHECREGSLHEAYACLSISKLWYNREYECNNSRVRVE